MASCWETPISRGTVHAPGDPTRRATLRPGSVSDQEPWGTASVVDVMEEPGHAGVGRGADHRIGHQVDDRSR